MTVSLAALAASAMAQGPGGQLQQFGQPPAGAGMSPAAGQLPPMGQPGAGAPAGMPPRATGGPIGVNGLAVVDVAYIFKNHQRFKQQMDQMKQKVDAAESDLKRDQQEMQKMAEQLKTYNPSSPEYKKMEEDLLKRQGDFNVKKSLQGKDFMEQEGQIYFKVSMEIDDAVKTLATRNNIALVMKFNGDQVDPNDRNDILRSINKPIVYYDPHMDITLYVLQELNRSAGVTMNPAGNNMVPQPRR
jgi:Skp family chaperone for outer membrane proteins